MKICTVSGCNRVQDSKGLCSPCYQEKWRKKHKAARKPCSTPGCVGFVMVVGKCQACYDKDRRALRTARWDKKQKQARQIQIAQKRCFVYGCKNSPRLNRRSCEVHAKRSKTNPEYATVGAHLHYIRLGLATYIGMPFYAGWNPREGGSIRAGSDWILANLGPRPTDGRWQLHIVDRRVGFMPGNLQWMPQGKHRREEMINKLMVEIRDLRVRLALYEPVARPLLCA